ncbi:MAG: TIM-barrel domain-containing protein [Myxococcales bacterium]
MSSRHAPWIEQEPDGTLIARHGRLVRFIRFLEPGIVRLQYSRRANRSRAVVERAWPAVELRQQMQGDLFVAESSELRLSVDRAGPITLANRDGALLLEDPADSYRESASGWTLSRPSPATERFYGFGEKTGPLLKRGQAMTFWNTDPFGDKDGGYAPGTDPLYVSIPFFIALRGNHAYGVLTDDTYRLRFDMASRDPLRWSVEADGGVLDQYFVYGPAIRQVVSRYTALTGRMPLPPRWTLGYHQSRWGYYPDEEVRAICRSFRERGIPADGIWLDIQHMDGFRCFTWDPKGFPNPRALIAELEATGFKTTVILDPGIKTDPDWDVYREGLERGCYVQRAGEPYVDKLWPGDSVFPDFSSPRAREWWAGLMRRSTEVGVRGIWIDMNEPATVNRELGRTLPNDSVAENDGEPSTYAEFHNAYALEEAKATREGLLRAEPERRPFILTRAGYAGIQRYAALWTGDAPSKWETLRETLPMLLGLGLSGVAFVGSDVGGFSGKATPELFARWMQLGAFSPFFRGHCSIKGQRQEPWSFGERVERICRDVIRERYRLLPYLYSLIEESTRTGAPLLRPLVYAFQDDPATHAIDDQAMLGPWLMLAPVLEQGAVRREVYLPRGRWADYWSGAILEGPARVEVEAPLERIPLFVREGALLPCCEPVDFSEQQADKPLWLELFPSTEESSFELYEDEGEGHGFERGAFCRIRYSLRREADRALLCAGPRGGTRPLGHSLLVHWKWTGASPARVLLGDAELPRVTSVDELVHRPGWLPLEGGAVASVGRPSDFSLAFVVESSAR